MGDFETLWKDRLTDLDKNGRLRRLRPFARRADGRLQADGRALIDFSSNDYLGLSRHPELIRRTRDFTQKYGAGAGASRLATGELPPFATIEAKLAAGKAAPAALLFVSGFQANASILPTLFDRTALKTEPVVFTDQLSHASLIQGCLAAGTRQLCFRHNDLGHLEALLKQHAGSGRPLFIVTETVFGMDGDRADLPVLTALAERFGAFLYLDDAHATGIFGPGGFGLAHGLAGPRCLVMGSFSKALGGFGAYVACTPALRDYLINRCPGLIYATALPPAVLGAMDAALDLLPGLDAERARVLAHAASFRESMAAVGLDTGASTTQIVPVILGSEERALRVAHGLEEQGFLGVAVRPPTVPAGQARLRLAFSARHTEEEVAALARALGAIARG